MKHLIKLLAFLIITYSLSCKKESSTIEKSRSVTGTYYSNSNDRCIVDEGLSGYIRITYISPYGNFYIFDSVTFRKDLCFTDNEYTYNNSQDIKSEGSGFFNKNTLSFKTNLSNGFQINFKGEK